MFQALVSVVITLASLPFRIFKHFSIKKSDDRPSQNEDDHPLLKTFTGSHKYTTLYATYPSIRTFYHAHPHADKLKAIDDLPLLVFIHGLGGSLPQFALLLGSFVGIAPTFGIELPGHGSSEFEPSNFEAYAFEALVELWKVAIEEICSNHHHRKVVLVCHSLGCSIGAQIATSGINGNVEVIGIVAICPKATPPTRSQSTKFRRMLSLPDYVLDTLRFFDRLGDESSESVKRFVGEAAGVDLKRLQLRFNKQFRTPVWKRTSIGLLPHYDKKGIAHGGLPGHETWKLVDIPLLLIAGESDTVTKPSEASDVLALVQGGVSDKNSAYQALPVEGSDCHDRANATSNDEQFGLQPSGIRTESQHSAIVKLVVLPAPASHALMYDHSSYRTVAGLIEDFLSRYVSYTLELGWQLQQLTTTGKWDVKNLEKWKKVMTVSAPIDGGLFRALKTLREQDEEHSPSIFLRKWEGKIYALIDISHDNPVYDTKALERGGVQYHKFPTVSKIPPTLVEVHDFIALVDRLRLELEEKHPDGNGRPAIGVHCHYGYNRTGFFIVCYLIERRGYSVQDAIEEFAKRKPPGIKHDHFIDTLFVRYCIGLRRGSTFK